MRSARWIAALVAITAALIATGTAYAGTYSVWSCRGPDWRPTGTEGWSPATVNSQPGDVEFADSCARGGALRVTLAEGRAFDAPVAGSSRFAAPAGTRIVGYRFWRSLAVAPPGLLTNYDYEAGVAESAGGTAAVYGCATRNSECRSAGDTTDPASDANLAQAQRAPIDAVALQVGCRLAKCTKPSGVPATAALYRARIDLEEWRAPGPVRLSGDLTDGEPVVGRSTLVVASADIGAGVAAMTLSVDDRQPQRVKAGCHEPFDRPQPCPTEAAEAFEVDATALPEGSHVASGTVVDAAGNVTTWQKAFTVRRPAAALPPATAAPPPLPGTGATLERLALTLDDELVLHRPGRVATLRGRLRTLAGAAVAGARLSVTAVDLGVRRRRPTPFALPGVTTDARGGFAIRIRRDGAQLITVAHTAGPVAVRASATVRARLSVTTSRATRSRLLKGRSLTLRGHLRGAGRSARGALVHIESIVNGRWSPVGIVRAGTRGRFRWRYRFVHLERDTIFRFRAVVRHQPGWPWPTRRSSRFEVRVYVP